MTPPDTKPLEERIVKGEAKLSEIDAYLLLKGQYDRTAAEAKTTQAEHDDCDVMIDAFGPSGLRLAITSGEGLDEFQGAIAESMAAMGFTFDLGPILKLQDDPHVNGRPSRMLSDSEKILFSLAFACAVARWSKLGIVCVDAWDTLKDEAQQAASSVLGAQTDLQRFVFTTPNKGIASYIDAAKGMNASDGVRFYLVERTDEGSVVTLPMVAVTQ